MNKHSEDTGQQLLGLCMAAHNEARNSPLTNTLVGVLNTNFPKLRPAWRQFLQEKQVAAREAAIGVIHEEGRPAAIQVSPADMGFPAGMQLAEPTFQANKMTGKSESKAPNTPNPSNAIEVDMAAAFGHLQHQQPGQLNQPLGPQMQEQEPQSAAAALESFMNDGESAGKDHLAVIEGTQELNADEIAKLIEAGKSAAALFPIERLQKTCLVMGIPNAELTPRQMAAAIKQAVKK